MKFSFVASASKHLRNGPLYSRSIADQGTSALHRHRTCLNRRICTEQYRRPVSQRRKVSSQRLDTVIKTSQYQSKITGDKPASFRKSSVTCTELQLYLAAWAVKQSRREILGVFTPLSKRKCDSYYTTKSFRESRHTSEDTPSRNSTYTNDNVNHCPKFNIKHKITVETTKERRIYPKSPQAQDSLQLQSEIHTSHIKHPKTRSELLASEPVTVSPMTSDSSKPAPTSSTETSPAQHRPLVVGLTKRSSKSDTMASSQEAAALNRAIEENLTVNTKSAAPADEAAAESSQPKQKKEKAPKQPKPPKAAPPPPAPTSPALIDLRVGHILRAITHPNADSLYVSTIAMGDPEGTEHTQVDEETGKVVRTVCSGLNGLVPLAEMQDRKIIVVANLKPVNMRSIKSAAMVLAASPKPEEGADPHAADRIVELVMPPEGSEAGDKVYFEGWPYGEGKGPEKQLNPKKKQWEAIQPGFYTADDLSVGFDASRCDEVSGSEKGNLVVEGKGVCTVKTLKGAVVR